MRKLLAVTAAVGLMSAGAMLPTTAMAGPNCGTLSPPSTANDTASTGEGASHCVVTGTGREEKNGPGVSSAETQKAPNVMGGQQNGDQTR